MFLNMKIYRDTINKIYVSTAVVRYCTHPSAAFPVDVDHNFQSNLINDCESILSVWPGIVSWPCFSYQISQDTGRFRFPPNTQFQSDQPATATQLINYSSKQIIHIKYRTVSHQFHQYYLNHGICFSNSLQLIPVILSNQAILTGCFLDHTFYKFTVDIY